MDTPTPASNAPAFVNSSRPSVGRTVHYHPTEEESYVFGGGRTSETDPIAAVITAVKEDGTVHLTLFPPLMNPTPLHFPVGSGGPEGTTPRPGSWTWVPRL